MIIPSNEFKGCMAQDKRNFINYADVTLANGTVLNLTPANFRIDGNTITDSTSGEGSCFIGNAIGKSATLNINNTDDSFSAYDFYMATFVLYVALALPSGTTEKLRKGTYTVITPETLGSTITISGVDDMYKFDKPYSNSQLTYPATLHQILSEACTTCGVNIGFSQFDNYNIINDRLT